VTADKGERVASEIGGVFAQVDVTSDEAVEAAFAKAREAHGQERILVNCAGVANAMKTVGRDKETKAVKRYPIHQFELAIQINLIGTFRCIAVSAAGMADLEPLATARRLHRQHRLRRRAGWPDRPGGLQRVQGRRARHGAPIARDLMGEGIRVNTILPGVFETPMVAMMPQNVATRSASKCLSQAPGPGRGICPPRGLHGRERVHERRTCPPRRRHPHGAALTR
jgi:NAD(P)-dependent dehydrogenase (short-subunit alcohol dehydrogenase family)